MYNRLFFYPLLIPLLLLIFSFSAISQNLPVKDLVVHEWAIFGTLHGSDGSQLSGLYAEDETVPKFVYRHKLSDAIYNLFNQQEEQNLVELKNVTLNIESSVTSFYSKTAKEVSVDVGFSYGLVNKWYPQCNSVDELPTEIDNINFSIPFNGLISWNNVQILTPDSKIKFSSSNEQETETWINSRTTGANKIMVNNEIENFLFYSAIGNLTIPFQFNFSNNKELKIINSGEIDIPYLFVFENTENGPNVWWTGGLKQNETVNISSTKSSYAFVDAKLKEFQKALMKLGLYENEVIAMFKTLESSYFTKRGFRIFYILNPKEVALAIPINIIPEPLEIKRVFIGKCDIFTPEIEQQLLLDYKTDYLLNKYRNNRYYLGMLQRANNLKSNY